MRVLFIVQGEGRGHLTQAISLAQILQSAGHEVIGAWVSVADGRPIAPFFMDQFTAPITPVEGPGLTYCKKTNALDAVETCRQALKNIGRYRKSLRLIRDAIQDQRPDVVVNFFELLGGLTYAFHRPSVPMVCIAHQCLSLHPDFPFPKGKWFERLTFKWLVKMNAWGAQELLGLSFDRQIDVPEQRLRVVPPLLRQEVTTLQPSDDSYVLAYTTQPGLQTEVLKAHHERPDVAIRYFHAGVNVAEQPVDATLTYYRIDGKRYLDAMQHCQAVVTTAGFESVCEALYLGKPVLMIPQPNHYEQMGNALDGQRAGVGVASDSFNLNQLLDYLPNHDSQVSERFRQWYNQGHFLFLSALNRAANSNRMASTTGQYGAVKPA
ncbi:glycosyltransferase family protein [Spirosoma flavus]